MLRFVLPSQHRLVNVTKLTKSAESNLMASKLMVEQGESGLISGAILGRIKGTGFSLRGLEPQILVSTPKDVVIIGRKGAIRWRKPLLGLRVGNQSIDAVRLTAADGDSVNFTVGLPLRPRVIKHLRLATELAAGIVAGSAALMTTLNGTFGLPGDSESHQRLTPDQIRDLVQEAGEMVMQDEESDESEFEETYEDDGDFE